MIKDGTLDGFFEILARRKQIDLKIGSRKLCGEDRKEIDDTRNEKS